MQVGRDAQKHREERNNKKRAGRVLHISRHEPDCRMKGEHSAAVDGVYGGIPNMSVGLVSYGNPQKIQQ